MILRANAAERLALKNDMTTLFKRFDVDGNGKISVNELRAVFEAINPHLTTAELGMVMKEVDINKDGAIDIGEFISWTQASRFSSKSLVPQLRDAAQKMDENRLQKDVDLSIPFEIGMTLEYHGRLKEWNFKTCAELNAFGPKCPGTTSNDPDDSPGDRCRKLKDPKRSFHALPVNCFSVDWEARNFVTGSADHTLKLWNLYGNVMRTFSGSTCEVLCVNVDWRNNQMISGQLDNSLMIWHLDDSVVSETFRVPGRSLEACTALGRPIDGGVGCVDVDWRKGHAICCVTNHLLLWNIEQVADEVNKDGTKVPHTEPMHVLKGHEDAVTAVIVDWAHMIATSGSLDRSLRQWDLNTGTQLRMITDGVPQITCMSSRRGFGNKFLATGDLSGGVRYWDLEKEECLAAFADHTGEITTLSPIERGHIASGSKDGTVRVFCLQNETCKRKLDIDDISNGLMVVGLSMHPPNTRSIERHGTFGGGRLSLADPGLEVEYE